MYISDEFQYFFNKIDLFLILIMIYILPVIYFSQFSFLITTYFPKTEGNERQ
jgi:hypothetical protein